MVEKQEPDTFAGLVSHLVSFLTVAIHTILYERRIYPKESFLTARAYNFPVRQSRHPGVCKWINDAVNAVETQLLQGHVEKICVVIIHPETYAPLERFVFDISKLITVSASDVNTPFVREGLETADETSKSSGSAEPKTGEWVDLDEQLRAVMSKLSVCGNTLKPIPEGCTFTVAIELEEEGKPPVEHPQAWIPSEPGSQRTLTDRSDTEEQTSSEQSGEKQIKQGKDLRGVRTVPIRSVEAGELTFEMWIEEGRAKVEKGVQNSSVDSAAS